jgi:F0F1-type ATP synthase assembly protein I
VTNKNQQDRHHQVQKDRLNNYARFTGIGFQMLATIGLGVFAGIKLDEHYPNQYQLFSIICSLASIGIALYSVIKQVTKSTKK